MIFLSVYTVKNGKLGQAIVIRSPNGQPERLVRGGFDAGARRQHGDPGFEIFPQSKPVSESLRLQAKGSAPGNEPMDTCLIGRKGKADRSPLPFDDSILLPLTWSFEPGLCNRRAHLDNPFELRTGRKGARQIIHDERLQSGVSRGRNG